MTGLVCVMIFIILTAETPDMFAGRWHTPMGVGFPLLAKRLPHLPFSLMDLALALIGAAVMLRRSGRRERVGPLDLSLLVSIMALAAGIVWGALRGGDVSVVYFQLQGLIKMFLVVNVLLALFRSPGDLMRLVLTIGAAGLYRAGACVTFFFMFLKFGTIDHYPSDITGHDDSALWAITFVGIVCWAFASRTIRAWVATPLLLLLLGAAINYNNRRLAWVEVLGGVCMMLLAAPQGALRRRFVKMAVVAAPVLLLYVATGWERPSGIFAPVEKIKSVLGPSEDDSSLSRDIENAGLVVTLGRGRFLGVGFGHEYDEVSNVYSAGMREFFPQYLYIPHNSLVGLVAFTGALLFPLIWAPVPVGAFLAARAAQFSRTTRDRSLSMIAFAMPFVYAVQAYGDMGLQASTANVLLAAGLALSARCAVTTGAWPVRKRRRQMLLIRAAVAVSQEEAPRAREVG
jgi:hypothetical protein